MASSSKQPFIAAKKSVLAPVMTLEGHEPYMMFSSEGDPHEVRNISCISYFPDGKQIISGSGDKTIRRWDLREGKEIKEAQEVFEHHVYGVRVSRDGRWVVTAVGGVLKVCEVETGIVRAFHDGLVISCIEISADSTLLAGGPHDGIRIWSLDTGKLVAGPFKLSGEFTGAIGLSQDSRKLAVTSLDLKCKQKLYLQVWDVQSQNLVVTGERSHTAIRRSHLPVFWTTKGKFITRFNLDDDMSIYEYDASTLKTVGDSFQGHTKIICLTLSFDCLLLAGAFDDNAIKLWSIESRQLLASFDVQAPSGYCFILSPDSRQLTYTTWDEARIYVCDIPVDILAGIGLAKETSAHLAKLLDSDATCHPVRRKPAISVIPSVPRPLAVTIKPPQPVFLGFLRKLLSSSRTDTIRPTRTNEPRNPLDFPATAPLPRPIVNSHDNFQPPTTQPSAPTPTTFKSRLSIWWSLQTDCASTTIVDVPLAQGKERNAAAGAPRCKNDEWIPDEDHVSSPPSPNPDIQQPTIAGQVKTNAGEHGSSRLCFCF